MFTPQNNTENQGLLFLFYRYLTLPFSHFFPRSHSRARIYPKRSHEQPRFPFLGLCPQPSHLHGSYSFPIWSSIKNPPAPLLLSCLRTPLLSLSGTSRRPFPGSMMQGRQARGLATSSVHLFPQPLLLPRQDGPGLGPQDQAPTAVSTLKFPGFCPHSCLSCVGNGELDCRGVI